jgi:diadenylate cyclase
LVVIIFQPELREGLVRLGQRHFFYVEPKKEDIEKALKEIVSAAGVLSRKKMGALVAIKREMGLKNYIESGVPLNADLTSELLQNIFCPSAPLHDGGVIIEGMKIVAASCLLPLSDNPHLSKTLGMRHRAGMGLSEHSDALVIIVSEENGALSLAIKGQLTQDLSPDDLLTILRGQLSKRP